MDDITCTPRSKLRMDKCEKVCYNKKVGRRVLDACVFLLSSVVSEIRAIFYS